MGFTIAEKILARVSGKTEVRAGDDLLAKPDFVIAYDFPGYTDVIFRQMEEEFGIEIPDDAAETIVSIEMLGSTRSINAAVASGIAMHTWIRQHVHGHPC